MQRVKRPWVLGGRHLRILGRGTLRAEKGLVTPVTNEGRTPKEGK